ncbi:hypothetical protein INT45_011322 [Circinella minor]|uniref:Uncharacterized protein n=1 Tax=Circinella minor TaxID=1195481 RepID=A0A8H7RRY4_9FUNG|nr:hypothetical protein INT45_011322 [Circinella minor]
MSKRFYGQAFVTDTTNVSVDGKLLDDEQTIRPIRQPRRMKRLLGTVKRQIFGSSYDPYQRDQVVKEKNEEGETARDERPTKRRRSIASTLINSISTVAYELFWNTGPPSITDEKQHLHHYRRRQHQQKILRGRDIDFSHFQTSSAWELRLQQAEQFIRRVCLQSQQQQQERQQRNNESSSWFGLPPFAAEAYRRAVEEDNNKWGLVSKEDYEVCFLPTVPPPKPKRNIQQQQPIVPQYQYIHNYHHCHP